MRCARVTEKIFDSMTNEKRTNWLCRVCVNKQQKITKKPPKNPSKQIKNLKNCDAVENIEQESRSPQENMSPLISPNTKLKNNTPSSQISAQNTSALQPQPLHIPQGSNYGSQKNNSALNLNTKLSSESLNKTAVSPKPDTILCQSTENYQLKNRENLQVNIPTSNSFSNLAITDDEDDDSLSDMTSLALINRSCPESGGRVNVREELTEARKKVVETEKKLASAYKLIDKYLIENADLKNEISLYKIKVDKLNRICTSTSNKKTSSIDTHQKNISKKLIHSTLQKIQRNLTQEYFASTPIPTSSSFTAPSRNLLTKDSDTSIQSSDTTKIE
ncbi:hypothetical protein O0L34_g17886 [Tuta absoluta]|nr:hypothetical protein O0L34_g17886 [Tuta absoluta]